MPLDISPPTAAATAPVGASNAAASNPGAVPSGIAALFGLLLARTVSQTAPAAITGSGSTASGSLLSKSAGPAKVPSGTTDSKEKAKSQTQENPSAVPISIPLLPMITPAAPLPAALSGTPLGQTTEKNGPVMDTAQNSGGELLSQTAIPASSALAETAQGQTDSGATVIPVSPPSVLAPAAGAAASGMPPAVVIPSQDSVQTGPSTLSPAALPSAGPGDRQAAASGQAAAALSESASPALAASSAAGSAVLAATVAPVALAAAQAGSLAQTGSPGVSPSAKPQPKASNIPTVTTGSAAAISPSSPPASRAVPVPVSAVLQKSNAAADNQAGTPTGNPAGTAVSAPKPAVQKSAAVGQDQKPQAAILGNAQTLAALLSGNAASAPSTRPATASMPAADRTQMLNQVSAHVQTMAAQTGAQGQRQVTLQLHPQDWGQIRVSVTMTPTTQADGKVTTQVVAHVVADQPTVKAALETHQGDLRQSLKEAGLTLDRITVTVRPDASGAQAGAGQNPHEDRSGWDGTPRSAPAETSAQSGAAGSGGQSSAFAAFGQGGQSSQGRPQAPLPTASVGQSSEAEPETVSAPLINSTGRVDTRA